MTYKSLRTSKHFSLLGSLIEENSGINGSYVISANEKPVHTIITPYLEVTALQSSENATTCPGLISMAFNSAISPWVIVSLSTKITRPFRPGNILGKYKRA